MSPSAPGYKKILVHPKVVGDVQSARASIDSMCGRASVDWSLEEERFSMNVEVPTGVEAEVKIPVKGFRDPSISEKGKTIWKKEIYIEGAPGVLGAENEDDEFISFSIGSGTYEFLVSHGTT